MGRKFTFNFIFCEKFYQHFTVHKAYVQRRIFSFRIKPQTRYGIHIFSSLKISNKNTLKNILEI